MLCCRAVLAIREANLANHAQLLFGYLEEQFDHLGVELLS